MATECSKTIRICVMYAVSISAEGRWGYGEIREMTVLGHRCITALLQA